MNDTDILYLRRCIELASEAVDAGDAPFGSILVSRDGEVMFEERNRIGDGDVTHHPEYAIVRWAIDRLSLEERRETTVYTSGEHCAMCAAAHGLAGLGRIVYASSSEQYDKWMTELGKPPLKIKSLRITDVIKDANVEGPVEEFAEIIGALHSRSRL